MVYFGKAHQESDIVIYVPEEAILFVGDLFSTSGNVDFTNIDEVSVER